jgi:hypothetical protein
MDLPPEIRNIIYRKLVVVGTIEFARDKLENKKMRPLLALLRVSKQIHAEAEPLYLANNLFRLPLDWFHCRPFMDYSADFVLHGDTALPQLFSMAGLSLIRNLSFAFNDGQIRKLANRDTWDDYEEDNGSALFHAMLDFERGDLVDVWQHSKADQGWDEA